MSSPVRNARSVTQGGGALDYVIVSESAATD